jgi:hypothetical protein
VEVGRPTTKGRETTMSKSAPEGWEAKLGFGHPYSSGTGFITGLLLL